MCIHLWTRTCEHVYTHGHTTIHIHINNKKERQVHTQRLEKEKGVNPASQGLGGSKRPLQQAGICRMPVCGCRRRQGSWEAEQGGKAEAFKGLLRSWDLMLCVVNWYRETSRPNQGKTHAPPTSEVSRGCLKGCGRLTSSLRCHQIGGFIFQWLLQLLSARLCNTKCWNVLLYPREIFSVRDEWGHRN